MKRKLKYGLILAIISGFLPLSALLAGQCPSNIDAVAQDYRDQGYTVFHCQSNASVENPVDPVNDTFNAQICGSGSGVTIEASQIGDPLNLGPQQVNVYNIKSTGGSVDNQQTQPWGGFTNISIQCTGDYYIAYQFTDEMASEDPSAGMCCPAGDSCDKPNLPTCESNDQGNPTADDSNSDDTTDISNNDSDNSNIISDQQFFETTFQGGRDGSETRYFANKQIVNVVFDNITIDYGNDRDWGMVFNNSTIKSTTFHDSQDLPTILFQGSSLDDVTFQNVEMYWTIFYQSNMKKVEFINSVLLRPDFSEVDLRNTTFEGTIICDANLTDTTFDQDTFKGATVFKAYYSDNGLWTAANIDGNIVDDAQAPKECQNYQ